MSMHSRFPRPARALSRPPWTVGVLATLALLSACSDPVSPDNLRAPVPASFSHGPSSASGDFAVLANAAVTCTDGLIVGDVGTFQARPTGSVTRTRCRIMGTVHVGDAAAIAAYNAFVAEYDALAPDPDSDYCELEGNTLTGTLAGEEVPAGTYCVNDVEKTGVLTLTGDGEWTFLVLGALTGTSFSVIMADGGEPCHVTWWVEAAATLTDSHFIGTILAGAGITLTRGTFHGNAYSQADVTVTGTEVTGCEGSTGGGNGGGGHGTARCNQGVGNGPEVCDPGRSNHRLDSNDEDGGTQGNPGRKGGR